MFLALALASACGDDSQRATGEAQTSAPTSVSMSGITLSGDASPTGMSEGTGGTGGGSSATGDASPGTTVDSSFDEVGGDTAVDACDQVLHATARDFREAHPDFEYKIKSEKGIVKAELGDDDRPVYASDTVTATTTGKANFDQWYRDVDGVNMPFAVEIPLKAMGGGSFSYDNPAFFVLDDRGFGNEGHEHNFHFTLELHTQFVYRGGEVFRFRGDDDLFVFINRELAMDLGGVHGPQEAEAVLDDLAGELGITPGGTYPLDFFFAERHTQESNFRIETTIDCLLPPVG